MDITKIKDILEYNDNSLLYFKESERDLYNDIDFKVNRFLEKKGLNIVLITGLRGVGKTTILKTISKKYDGLYTSGDHLKTKGVNLEDVIKTAREYDKKIIIIDEILYLSNWQTNLKILSDSNQDILFLISGSSAMQLNNISQDLFRRLDIYKLKPLSFREYYRIKNNLDINFNLNFDIFSSNSFDKIFLDFLKESKKLPKDIFKSFNNYYLDQFPFILEETNKKDKIYQLVEKIIYKDMPQIDNIYSEHLKNAELIIKFISSTEKINYSNISKNLEIKKDMVIKIIDLFEKSELIKIVKDIVPTRELRSNRKVLFNSSSIRIALNSINLDKVVGFSREDMFYLILNNLDLNLGYNYKQNGFDYLVNNIKFEIGNNKTNLSKDVIVVGDFLDLDYKKGVLYIPFFMFALLKRR